MQGLQAAVQDAQYIGAVTDGQSGSSPPSYPKPSQIPRYKLKLSRKDPGTLSFSSVLESPLGYHLFYETCSEDLKKQLDLLADAHKYKETPDRRRRAQIGYYVFHRYCRGGVCSVERPKFMDQEYPRRQTSYVDTTRTEIALASFNNPDTIAGADGEIYEELERTLGQKEDNSAPPYALDVLEACVARIIENAHWEHFQTSPSWGLYLKLKLLEGESVTLDDFVQLRVLGRGAFGMVNGCMKRATGKLYAMKVLKKRLVKSKHAINLILNEREMLARVNSPFVTNLKYAFSTKDDLYLAIDLMTGGDLSFQLSKSQYFNEETARFIAAQVLLGLEHLHSKGIIYRDLKPQNILMDAAGNIKLADLGLSCFVMPPPIEKCGTRGYWAPEITARSSDGDPVPYNELVDWWSFGCLVYEMLVGVSPFRSSKAKKMHEDKKLAMDIATLSMEVDYDGLMSKEAKSLCQGLLQRDPSERLGARGSAEIRRHSWFASLDWDEIMACNVKPPLVPSEEINSLSQDRIGSFKLEKNVVWNTEDDRYFERWNYVSSSAFQEEMIDLLRRNGKDAPRVASRVGCCSIV